MKLPVLVICSLVMSFCCYAQYKEDMVKAFQQGHYDSVTQLAERLLGIDSNDIDARLGLARGYNQQYAFAKAIPHLKKVLETGNKDWQFSWADIELMTSYYAIGDTQQARYYYEEARKLHGTENSNEQLQHLGRLFGFDGLYNDWKTAESKDIIFHFETSVDSNIARYIISTRQQAFDSINAFFHAAMPKKIDFFVWKSTDIYNECLKSVLGFTRPEFCLSHNRTNQSSGHEIAHNISFWASRTKKYVRFINEGIGVCFDQGRYDKLAFAAKIFKAHPVDVKDLWINSSNYDENILYPIAGAFVQYLINYDKSLFLELNNDQTYVNAMTVYKGQIDTTIKQFTQKLQEL